MKSANNFGLSPHPYIPHTYSEVAQMLGAIEAPSVEELFTSIPDFIREKARRGFSEGIVGQELSEQELSGYFAQLARLNTSFVDGRKFLSGASFRHFVPAIVDHIVQRGEFLTSYTPYQPEVSQGTLQAIYEFQTLCCLLTGHEVANAGLYDSATSLLEAALLALRLRKGRNVILVAESLSVGSRRSLETVVQWVGNVEIVSVPWDERTGQIDMSVLDSKLAEHNGCVVALLAGYPNYFGIFENLPELSERLHKNDGLLVSLTQEALALGLVRGPALLGADISVGDFQSFGISASYGGPGCGFMATRQSYLREIPGRIVGQTTDSQGQRGYVLTLATREQHIKRERATSNICTNHALLGLAATVYLSLLGPRGLKELAKVNLTRRQYLEEGMVKVGCVPLFNGPRFNEVLLDFQEVLSSRNIDMSQLLDCLEKQGFLLDSVSRELAVSNYFPTGLLLSVTELNSRQDIDALVKAIELL